MSENFARRATTLLARDGHRLTRPRQALLEVLSSNDEHRSADQLALAVEGGHPGVDRSSVYRALALFTDLGLIQQVRVAHGADLFHRTGARHPHGQCVSCGTVVDLPHLPLETFAEGVAAAAGFVVATDDVVLAGVCGRCADPAG